MWGMVEEMMLRSTRSLGRVQPMPGLQREDVRMVRLPRDAGGETTMIDRHRVVASVRPRTWERPIERRSTE